MTHAIIIPEGAAVTQAGKADETGHWTRVKSETGNLADGSVQYITKDDAFCTFDEGLSAYSAIYLLELYDTIKNKNFSGETVNPLESVDKSKYLEGARKFYNLAKSFRDFELKTSDFESLTYIYGPDNTLLGGVDKSGPHPFIEYVATHPEHEISRMGSFKPYEDGGLPQAAEEVSRQIVSDTQYYGVKGKGYKYHKTVNDNVMSSYILFLTHYYETTNDASALQNLKLQLEWVYKVFEENGRRMWCNQYNVFDDECAPARPYEAPSLVSGSSVYLVNAVAYAEKKLEQLGETNPKYRNMLEDAIYYIQAELENSNSDPSEPEKYNFYALQNYTTSTPAPNTASAAISKDDPITFCDYYYPTDPFKAECKSNGHDTHAYYPTSSKEWPFSGFATNEVNLKGIDQYLIDPGCQGADGYPSSSRTNYDGCLNLNSEKANLRSFWDNYRAFWGSWKGYTKIYWAVDDYLEYAPDPSTGYWTSTYSSSTVGTGRTVIDSAVFSQNAAGIAKFLGQNNDEITDSDSDGLDDSEEGAHGTDPDYWDSDKDGFSDGDEVNLHGTDPLLGCDNPDSQCQGNCGNGIVEQGENCSSCPEDVQCGTGETCCSGTCCQAGQQCCSGTCTTPACNADSDCATGQECQNPGTCSSQCIALTQGCTTNADCSAGETCCLGQCCPTGQECCQGICCTTGQQCCNQICTIPVCSTDTECNDSDECTLDQCSNAGTCNAACTQTTIAGCGQEPETVVNYEREVEIGKTQQITVTKGEEQVREFTALLEYPNKTKITLIAANAKITIPVNQEGTYNAEIKAGDFEQTITFQGKTFGTGPEPEPADQTLLTAGLAIAIIAGAAIGLKKLR